MKRLIEIVERLRSPEGCPWDQKQTHKSLLPYLIEEAYEVIEEINEDRLGSDLKGELGDLLLQVVLHAQIAQEEERFNMQDVIEHVAEKMIRRHPHVFDDAAKNQTQEELTAQWDRIKAQEKKSPKLFDDIPKAKPALLRAKKIGERAAKLGFDWPDFKGVFEKIEEELGEVKVEFEAAEQEKLEGEIGDLLASVVSLARHAGVNPELALQKSNDKFVRRFQKVEELLAQARAEGREPDLDEMEAAWQAAKGEEA